MLLLNLPLENLQIFLFVLVRVAAIIFSVPFLEARNVPMALKASLTVAISIMLIPQLNLSTLSIIESPVLLVLGIGGEVMIGVMIGLSVQLLFTGVQLAGQIAGFQMGFAIANVVDPASSLQIPILSQFLNLFVLMIFFAINAHYYFIKALVDSFELVPPMTANFNGALLTMLMRMTANAFVAAVKISAPVMVSLLLTSVALGLTARTVPQMQIFIVAMPLKIILGFFFMGISLPFIQVFMTSVFHRFGETLPIIISLFR